MTIAACYLSSEGVVLGTDSTSTAYVSSPDGSEGSIHHLDYAQKVFEVGENSTLGICVWGMGAIGDVSHRTLIACFADKLASDPPQCMRVAAWRFCGLFWSAYLPVA